MITKRNDEIIKSVIREEFSNLTGEQIDTLCSKIAKGNKQDSCYDQLDGSRPSGKSDSVTLSYWKAVSKGYEGTITEFEKRKTFLNSALDYGVKASGFLSGLVGSNSSSSSSVLTTEEQGLGMGAKIGIGVGVVAVLGTVIYLVVRKK
jgi:hypothetical protein